MQTVAADGSIAEEHLRSEPPKSEAPPTIEQNAKAILDSRGNWDLLVGSVASGSPTSPAHFKRYAKQIASMAQDKEFAKVLKANITKFGPNFLHDFTNAIPGLQAVLQSKMNLQSRDLDTFYEKFAHGARHAASAASRGSVGNAKPNANSIREAVKVGNGHSPAATFDISQAAQTETPTGSAHQASSLGNSSDGGAPCTSWSWQNPTYGDCYWSPSLETLKCVSNFMLKYKKKQYMSALRFGCNENCHDRGYPKWVGQMWATADPDPVVLCWGGDYPEKEIEDLYSFNGRYVNWPFMNLVIGTHRSMAICINGTLVEENARFWAQFLPDKYFDRDGVQAEE